MYSSDQSRPATALRPETPSPSLASSETQATTPSPTNELFDDVFGSSPPGAWGGGAAAAAAADTDTTADGDGDAADGGSGSGTTPPQQHREPPDVARLRSTHTSAGYREGLSAAKEAALQPGFDEGYALGAALGMRAGLVLGLAEMLAGTLAVTAAGVGDGIGGRRGDEGEEARDGDPLAARMVDVVARCRRDLQRSSLLADQYIDMHGLWTWPVPTPAHPDIHQVAAAHPLISRWQRRVDAYCEALGVSVAKLEERWVDESEPTETKATTATTTTTDDDSLANTAPTVSQPILRGQMLDF